MQVLYATKASNLSTPLYPQPIHLNLKSNVTPPLPCSLTCSLAPLFRREVGAGSAAVLLGLLSHNLRCGSSHHLFSALLERQKYSLVELAGYLVLLDNLCGGHVSLLSLSLIDCLSGAAALEPATVMRTLAGETDLRRRQCGLLQRVLGHQARDCACMGSPPTQALV